MAKKNYRNKKIILIKLILSVIYLSVIAILLYSSFKIFTEDKKIVEWKNIEKTNQYAYLEINQMSEAFAKIGNKQIHFVMEKEVSGAWHTYLIAINSKDYSKYKQIIDYTYERVKVSPKTIKVYGYPVEIPKKIKTLAIKNIKNFVPVENEVIINDDNFEKYLTNTYLDTTQEKLDTLNYRVLILLISALIIFLILIYTIFDKSTKLEKNEKTKKTTKKASSKKNASKQKAKKEEKTTKKDTKKKDQSNETKKTGQTKTKEKEEDIEII